MSNASDFVIENGVLKKYVGLGGDVIVPEGVTKIGFQTFYKNKSITTVTLPQGLITIDGYAFGGNTAITEITFPDSLKEIGQHAFIGCTGLKDVMIPASVEKLGEWHADVFPGCDNLVSIEVDPGNKKYKSIDGVLYSKTVRSVQFCPKGKTGIVELPASVTTINAQAFYGCEFITEVSVPDHIKKIGYCSFYNCKMLKKINLPDKLEIIFESAFEGCASLQNVRFPALLTTIERKAFLGCNSLKEVSLPSSINKLGASAFSEDTIVHCNTEQFKKLPESVRLRTVCAYLHEFDAASPEKANLVSKYVKEYKEQLLDTIIDADDDLALCTYLDMQKKVDYDTLKAAIDKASTNRKTQALLTLTDRKNKLFPPEKMEAISKEQLEKSLGVKERSPSEWKKIFKYSCSNGEILISGYKSDEIVVEIPAKIGKNTVVAIGKDAFYNCQQLQQVYLPETLKIIDDRAFYYCRNLKSINIPEGITTIGRSAFESCESLQDVVLPETVTSIGRAAFSCCTSLTVINIPDGVKNIEDNTFRFCKKLTSLNISESVRTIGENAFQGCDELADSKGFIIVKNILFGYVGAEKDITIPNSVEHIDARIFASHNQLQTIVISERCISIGMAAFWGCTNLQKIFLYSGVVSIDANVFRDCPVSIHAPAGSYAERYAKENHIPFVAE